jgi:GntR family transcriptional regulator, transcriptional repressor for pyruvate dehydrogenase complex
MLPVTVDELSPAPRPHVSDHVFAELARAILQGAFTPGSALPSERLLVERFKVSRNIARQALHRLAEMGLVQVRQGGATVVLDPHEATDLRVLALFYRLTGQSRPALDTADMIEKQYLQGLSIVEAASRRASPAALDEIARELDSIASDAARLADFALVEEQFWRALAVAAENRIFRMEVAWWYDTLPDRPVPPEVASADPLVRLGFYRELVRRLVSREHPTEYYLGTTRPLLDAVLARAAEAK